MFIFFAIIGYNLPLTLHRYVVPSISNSKILTDVYLDLLEQYVLPLCKE